ncbi:MAG: UMP kinase [Candidatus Sumerlaeota bacterium]|nr:UMP kinase [Candidatus Sumerlaeota bacterium]
MSAAKKSKQRKTGAPRQRSQSAPGKAAKMVPARRDRGGLPGASDLRYRRILLKLSGEAGKGKRSGAIDFDRMDQLVRRAIKPLTALGAQVGVVIGGGNLLRGAQAQAGGVSMDRTVLDDLGMLATVMNAVALKGACEQNGVEACVLSAVPMEKVAAYFTRDRARRLLDQGVVTIFAGGTGNPYFTTDSAAALRAAEIGAGALFKATTVDGVYDRDPRRHPDARRFKKLSFDEAIRRELRIMDLTAFSICRDQGIPIIIFPFEPLENIIAVAQGADLGTIIGG